MHYFTPREVEHLTGVQPSTVREWRRQIGRDIGRQEDSDRWRFTAGDALMIWMISRARDEDAGVMRAWQVGFWCSPAVEHYLGARVTNEVALQVWSQSAKDLGPRFAVFPRKGNPGIVGDLQELVNHRDEETTRFEVWDLEAMARKVPERLPLELRDVG